MSRLGKLPIQLTTGMEAKISEGFIVIKNSKGELKQKMHDLVKIDIAGDVIKVSVKDKTDKKQKALWGLYYSLIRNMVEGLSGGFQKKLEVIGVGYRMSLSGKKLTLNLGFSHPVIFAIPDGINAQVDANTITLSGADKQLVGETAALIRKIRKPEPYKGKGIKYSDEIIRRKEGKAAAK